MERVPVTSSNVAAVGYDETSATMEVEFLDGSIYQYFDVPAHVYEALLADPSPGGFMHREVRGVYRYARV